MIFVKERNYWIVLFDQNNNLIIKRKYLTDKSKFQIKTNFF